MRTRVLSAAVLLGLAGIPLTSAGCPGSKCDYWSDNSAYVCLALDQAWSNQLGLSDQGHFTVEGTVTGRNAPTTSSCFPSGPPADPTGYVELQITSASGHTGKVVVRTATPWRAPADGTAIVVDEWVSDQPYGLVSAHTIRANGALLLYVNDFMLNPSNGPEVAPEVTFARGPQICDGSDDCGDIRSYDLGLTSAAGSTTVAPGTVTRFGAWTAAFDQWTVETSNGHCADGGGDAGRWSLHVPAGAL